MKNIIDFIELSKKLNQELDQQIKKLDEVLEKQEKVKNFELPK